MDLNALRYTVAELIAFGIAGTMLESVHETLQEIDNDLADELELFIDKIIERFQAADTRMFEEHFGE